MVEPRHCLHHARHSRPVFGRYTDGQATGAARWPDEPACGLVCERQPHVHWRSTGLSAEAYSRERDIDLERLKYWARRVKRASSGVQLLPVRTSAPVVSGSLELRSPSGWSMRMDSGVDTAWLLQELR